MKIIPSLLCLLAGLLPAAAVDHVLIIGDSLSKEYVVEGAGIGIDVFPPPSPYPKNWCEMLDSRRGTFFDFGGSDVHSDIRAAGHDYNWSVPGSYASDWRNDYLPDPPGALEEQLAQSQVKRAVVWLGGNDVRESYGDLYNGLTSPSVWAAQTYSDIAFVLDWVVARRQPDVQVLLVNVAHLGATISKNRDFPFDAVKTGRVTTALDDLNARLAALTRARGAGLADIYTLTKELMLTDRISIGGWIVTKRASSDADTDAMFLGDGFHPNMPVQAIFAQTIVDAFNARWSTDIPRLTNREIVDKFLEENADVSFAAWTASYALPAAERTATSDPDRDGVPNIVEFGLDLDPSRGDARLLPQPRLVTQGAQQFLSLTWQPRDPSNTTRCEITPQQSDNLLTWTNVPAALIVSGSPNTRTVRLPVTPGQRIWLRLQVRQLGL